MPEQPQPENSVKRTHIETLTYTMAESAEAQTSPPEHACSPREEIFRELPMAIIFCALMAFVSVMFNKTSFGREFGLLAYRVLQGQLVAPEEDSNVIVVDISEFKQNSDSGVTPRPVLQSLIQAIADQGPKVIGVDIDFSPENSKFIDPKKDPKFFLFCQNLRARNQHVPVFLGIYRSQSLPPDEWLGLPNFKDLAAALLVPKENLKNSVWSLATENSTKNTKPNGMPEAPTMSTALATTYGLAKCSRLCSLFKAFSEHEIMENVALSEFLINYSDLDRLHRESIRIPKQDFSDDHLGAIMRSRSKDLSEKMVLIGDVDHPSDPFPSPTGIKVIPGVLVHASAAYTLTQAPLYGFPEIPEFILDFTVSLVLLTVILGLRLTYPKRFMEQRLAFLLNVAAAALVFGFGMSLNWTHVFWPDFFLLSIGLLMDSSAHRMFDNCRKSLSNWVSAPKP